MDSALPGKLMKAHGITENGRVLIESINYVNLKKILQATQTKLYYLALLAS